MLYIHKTLSFLFISFSETFKYFSDIIYLVIYLSISDEMGKTAFGAFDVKTNRPKIYRIDPRNDTLILETIGNVVYYNKDNDVYYTKDRITCEAQYAHPEQVIRWLRESIEFKKTEDPNKEIDRLVKILYHEPEKSNEKWPPHGEIQITVNPRDDVFTSYTNEKGGIPTSCGKENANKQVTIIVSSAGELAKIIRNAYIPNVA